MNGYSIQYQVEVDYENGDYDSDVFTNEENAREYLNDCIADGKLNGNWVEFYRITRTDTSGGIIVDSTIITEWYSDGYGQYV